MATNYSGDVAYIGTTIEGTLATAYWYAIPVEIVQPDGDAVLLRFTDLNIPPGALVRRVRCRVRASAPGSVPLEQVAEVRAAGANPNQSSSQIVLDFKGIRTIAALGVQSSSVTPSTTNVQYAPWLGSGFSYPRDLDDFAEVSTDRIRLDFPDNVSPAAVAAGWAAMLPSPPQQVDLVVNGGRVWSGGIATPAPPDSEFDVEATIDITAAVAAAVANGSVPVHVELTSTMPAQLDLSIVEEDVLHVHDVGFPEGARRRVERAEEGRWNLDLPLQGLPGAPTAGIRRLEMTVSADVGSTRVVPAEGPTPSVDATVQLAPGRTILVRLPASMLDRFDVLDGVRVMLATEGDIELAGEVLAGDASGPPTDPAPGAAIADVLIEPVIVEATGGSTRWVTLTLSKPVDLDGGDVWLSLHPVRGTASLSMTDATGTGDADRTSIRWQAASGSYRALSAPGGLPPLDAVVRSIGTPAPEHPLGSVTAHLGTRSDIAVVADPPATGQRFVIELGDDSVTATDQGLGGVPALRIEVLASTPGTYTFDQVRVFYTPNEE